ncbi:MAG: GxxExxY protein [bacterium]|nr:GxxExxY protein [bacterium]
MEKLLYKELSYQIQGAAIEVRKNFGPGHKESLYQNAFAEELTSRGITFEQEKSIRIYSPKTSKIIGSYKPDFVIEGKVLVELKALEKTPRLAVDQLYDYMRNSDCELGYFVNFSTPKLFMKRIIFTNDRKFRRSVVRPILLSFVVLSFIFVAFRVNAATPEIYFEVPNSITAGSEFTVKVLLDSDVGLNAYEVSFSYTNDKIEVVSFNNGGSIINIWQTQPTDKDGLIKWSGGSLSAFSGNKGELLSVRLKALGEGNAEFHFKDVSAYLADGKGTKIAPLLKNSEFDVVPQNSTADSPRSVIELTPQDTTPPQIESLSFIADPFNTGQKILSFAVRDVDSGIKETMARSRRWFFWGEWQAVSNPVALPNGIWAVDFRVHNNNGGRTEATIYDWNAFIRGPLLILLTFFGLIVIFLINRVLVRRRMYNKNDPKNPYADIKTR